jgi:NAD-reducing hydrogenase small subunit
MSRPRIATASLAGCFGCHMSLLDLDERFLDLAELVEFDRSPINDYKEFQGQCAVGLVEGGCANEENIATIREFRKRCDVLVSVGDCATMGGIPAMRNLVPLEECLQEAYVDGPTVYNPSGLPPGDPEIPRLLDRVYALHEVVHIDWHLPGCPPSPEAFWAALSALLAGEPVELPPGLIRYD